MNIKILTLLFLLLPAGCTTTRADIEITAKEIRTQKDAQYEKKLDSLLIAISADPALFVGQIGPSFSNTLQRRGIFVRSFELSNNPLDLNPSLEMNQMKALFKPNQIMELIVTRATKTNYYYDSFILQGTIYDQTTKKQVWRFIYSGSGPVLASKLVNAVVEKLETDGMLPPLK